MSIAVSYKRTTGARGRMSWNSSSSTCYDFPSLIQSTPLRFAEDRQTTHTQTHTHKHTIDSTFSLTGLVSKLATLKSVRANVVNHPHSFVFKHSLFVLSVYHRICEFCIACIRILMERQPSLHSDGTRILCDLSSTLPCN
jgi:hypothetical protein